ncbi:MAG TPA: FecR family protein, partial [Balneolaceae bacterium]|nr:FecR family protein [Balneolaceae bacterium]
MDRDLIEKYFNDQCSEEELEQVLEWFQTDEGQAFLKQDMEREEKRLAGNNASSSFSEVESKELFRRIQKHKKKVNREKWWLLWVRAASILLLVTALSSLVYWSGIIFQKSKKNAPSYKTYATNAGQQKVLTLSDGTKIRLNEQSSLRIPRQFGVKDRKVKLKGEAYFQVAHDKGHPFIIEANRATIKDLDTQFDVKADSAAGKVQVAVIRGRVLLKKEQKDSTGRTASAILTRNHLGILQLSDSQITIEKGGARNYLSWKTHRLVFKGLTL